MSTYRQPVMRKTEDNIIITALVIIIVLLLMGSSIVGAQREQLAELNARVTVLESTIGGE